MDWAFALYEGRSGIEGWLATMGPASMGPGGPTSCLANECLVSVAYCLFVLFL